MSLGLRNGRTHLWSSSSCRGDLGMACLDSFSELEFCGRPSWAEERGLGDMGQVRWCPSILSNKHPCRKQSKVPFLSNSNRVIQTPLQKYNFENTWPNWYWPVDHGQVRSEDLLQTMVFLSSWSCGHWSLTHHMALLFLMEYHDACSAQTHGRFRLLLIGQSSK